MPSAPLLTAALSYAKRGWFVFPLWEFNSSGCLCDTPDCDRPGKHPAVDWGTEATTDADKIREWWKERPARGIGIATGEKSGLAVLDIDGAEGLESLGKIPGAGAGLPITPIVESQTDHLHYYFAWSASAKTSQGVIGVGIDVRSNGGYVVAPPSPHFKSGGKYRWTRSDCELAEWPSWLSGERKVGKKKREEGARETFNPASAEEVKLLVDALSFIDPDAEETWVQCGWILGRAFRQSDAGFAIYSAWAAHSRKYNAKKSRDLYYDGSKAPREGEVLTTGSIYKWATDAGWVYDDGRPVIIVKEGQLHVQVDAAIAALAEAGDVYGRSGGLVEVIKVSEAQHQGFILPGQDREIKREHSSPTIHEFDVDSITVKLDRIARFERNGKTVGCPRSIAAGLLSVGQWDGIPPLHAITGSPFPRSDGTICDTPGFDRPSATMLFANGFKIMKVSDRPTRKEAIKALGLLREPFSEVPWKSAVHESSFIAFLLTLITRPIMPTSPAFLFSAPKAGNGKSLLVDCASIIIHGEKPTHRTYTADPDEQRKVLQSIMLAGDPLLLFDNVKKGSSIGGDVLSMYITSDYVGDRRLGHSDTKRIANSTCIAFTGNNISAKADFVRRALSVDIDAEVERPERRRFRIPNLPRHLYEARPKLIHALLTILRGFIADEAPEPEHAPVGSFEQWDRAVLGSINWLGLPDPIETQEELMTEDPEAEITGTLLRELKKETPPDQSWFTVDDMRRRFNSSKEFSSAIIMACEAIDKLGYWLKSHKNDIVDGLRLERIEKDVHGSAKWRVVEFGKDKL